jgi:hypothetical protein
VVFHFCELENIGFLVMRYLNTGALPFEEFSEDELFDGEELVTSISEMVAGGGFIYGQLLRKVRRWSLRI